MTYRIGDQVRISASDRYPRPMKGTIVRADADPDGEWYDVDCGTSVRRALTPSQLSPAESNPEYAVRMYEARCAGRAAGYRHARQAAAESPLAAATRLAADRPEDERERFVAGFHVGVDNVQSPRPVAPRRLQF